MNTQRSGIMETMVLVLTIITILGAAFINLFFKD